MIESSNNFQAVNFSITYKKIHIVYYSKIAVLVVPYRNILGRFTKKNQRDLYQPTYPLPKLSWIMGFLLTLLVIKISFFLEFSCFCTFCAENHRGTTQKKWQQCFSCLEMCISEEIIMVANFFLCTRRQTTFCVA